MEIGDPGVVTLPEHDELGDGSVPVLGNEKAQLGNLFVVTVEQDDSVGVGFDTAGLAKISQGLVGRPYAGLRRG